VRKVLYLSLKEFKSAQKRQMDGEGTTHPDGELFSPLALSQDPLACDTGSFLLFVLLLRAHTDSHRLTHTHPARHFQIRWQR